MRTPTIFSSPPVYRLNSLRRQRATEFQTAKQAFYVEPQDESTWLYHRWLLGRVLALADGVRVASLAGLGVPGSLGDAASLFLNEGLLELGKPVEERLRPQQQPNLQRVAACGAPLLRIPKSQAERVARRELRLVEEILRIEPSARFASLHRLLLLGVVLALAGDSADGRLMAEIRDLCAQLRVQDPLRTRYYQNLEQNMARAAEAQS